LPHNIRAEVILKAKKRKKNKLLMDGHVMIEENPPEYSFIIKGMAVDFGLETCLIVS